MRDSSIGPTPVSTTWPAVSFGSWRGARARWRASIHGMNTNWMKVNGRSTRMKTEPETRTSTENSRPMSDSKVMSPNPSVDIVTTVQ